MVLTRFETKLFEQGFIDRDGVILQGPFKNAFSITEINRKGPNGEPILVLMPTRGHSEFHLEIPLTAEDVQRITHTKNLMQIVLNERVLHKVCDPVLLSIATETARMEREVFIDEFKKTEGEIATKPSKGIERASFADHYVYQRGARIPDTAFEAMENMPRSFWEDPLVMSTFNSYFFTELGKASERFDTPEGIVLYKAFGNEGGNRSIGLIAKSMGTACDDRLLGSILDFDTNMTRKEREAENTVYTTGGEGK